LAAAKMNLPALKGGVSCKRYIVYEVRRTFGSTVRKLFNCKDLPRKPVYCHFSLAPPILTALKLPRARDRSGNPFGSSQKIGADSPVRPQAGCARLRMEIYHFLGRERHGTDPEGIRRPNSHKFNGTVSSKCKIAAVMLISLDNFGGKQYDGSTNSTVNLFPAPH
jgi:hypothetical protein